MICSALAGVMARFQPGVVYCWLDLANLLGGFAAAFMQVPRTILGQRTFPPPFWFAPPVAETYRQAYRALLRRPNVTMINICSAGAKAYQNWLGDDPEIEVVRIGFDPASVLIPEDRSIGEFRRGLGIPDGAPVVGGVMRFAPEKDPALWLRAAGVIAAARLDAHFILNGYGHDDIAVELHRMGEILGLRGRLHMPGLVRDVGRVYGAISVFLLTSRTEATANVLIEAQAAGVPVVCPAVGGLEETVLNRVTGVIARERSADQLAVAVLELLSDPAQREFAKKCGPVFIAQKFGLERMIEETISCCR
jgi:glycosyltransferase involved in cell wall biosynthesis